MGGSDDVAPPCKNCMGDFSKDHTHVFHGEDVCNKWVEQDVSPPEGVVGVYEPLKLTFAGKPMEWSGPGFAHCEKRIQLRYRPGSGGKAPWQVNYSGDGRNGIWRADPQDALDDLEHLLRADLEKLKKVLVK